MNSDELPKLPENFYPESNDPTEVLTNLWTETTDFRLKCNNCKNKIFASKILVNNIKPCIKYAERNEYKHPLYQLESWKELFYCVCPECDEDARMEGVDVDGF